MIERLHKMETQIGSELQIDGLALRNSCFALKIPLLLPSIFPCRTGIPCSLVWWRWDLESVKIDIVKKFGNCVRSERHDLPNVWTINNNNDMLMAILKSRFKPTTVTACQERLSRIRRIRYSYDYFRVSIVFLKYCVETLLSRL